MSDTLKDPNNLRNRWRRYRAARIAYGFTHSPFREWAISWGRNPDSYKAGQHVELARPFLKRRA